MQQVNIDYSIRNETASFFNMLRSNQMKNSQPTLVAVGSKNPVKIEATQKAFQKVWPKENWKSIGVSVASGVSAQPMSDKESIQGAQNRAQTAIYAKKTKWGVGLEGGLQNIGTKWFDCGWIAVVNAQGIVGLGSTARIITPPRMIELINQGMELGDVVDLLCNTQNAKQSEGHFGLMTQNAITRTSGYIDGVIMALTRFLQPHLFEP
jgi:inosine/xanthosine triphosphatase